MVSGLGTIRHFALEGGFYGIIADDGSKYLPVNLPSQFKVDSLRVEFKGTVEGCITVVMWGECIRLSYIRRLYRAIE